MSFKSILLAASTAAIVSAPALAADIMIKDAYARASSPTAASGAAFMSIMNHTDSEDRLVGVKSYAAQRVEIHTHIEDSNGVMRMVKVEDGIAVPASGMAMLKRGGDHVMFLGLTQPFEHGTDISVILQFENAGEIELTLPVDLERKPAHGHGGHAHTHSSDDS